MIFSFPNIVKSHKMTSWILRNILFFISFKGILLSPCFHKGKNWCHQQGTITFLWGCIFWHTFFVWNGFKTDFHMPHSSRCQSVWINVRYTNAPLCALLNLVKLTTNIFVNLHIEQKWLIWPRSHVTLMLESLVCFPYHNLLLLLNPRLLVHGQTDHWPSSE